MGIEILEEIKKALWEYNKQKVADSTQEALSNNVDPLSIMEVLTEAIRKVGDGFSKGDLFLPELVGAAEAMQEAMPALEGALAKTGAKRQAAGVVVLGTVAGDIHTIGKSMVWSLLKADGFEVHDIGIDVSAETFVGAVKKHSPDILAMSALLSTTAPEAGKVIEGLKNEGIRDQVKVMVGGGAMTKDLAIQIGSDGYEATAPGAVSLARQLLVQ